MMGSWGLQGRSSNHLACRPNEGRRQRGHNRIAISAEPQGAGPRFADEREGFARLCFRVKAARIAHSHQTGGRPINQRLNAGFNWPPLAVRAGDEFGSGPMSVNDASRGNWSSLLRPSGPVVAMPGVSATPRLTRIPELSASSARGVDQEAIIAKSFRLLLRSGFVARSACPPPVMSLACGVGQADTRAATPGNFRTGLSLFPWLYWYLEPVASFSVAVGHDPHSPLSLSDVRRTEARSAQIERPPGVVRTFHVS